ncbi:MAG: metal-dependent hydrolase [Chitinophagaceae bacterium]|nr:metal-dependent hydrolase [Chitinophagaceae bacterium]
MDSLTHIVLGACVGEVIAGKKLGKKSWLAGALFQTIPDLDFIAGFWLSPAEDLLAHRGFTHSFLFVILLSFFLATLTKRVGWCAGLSSRGWLFFSFIELLIHVLIDAMNVYGTAWLEPFSHTRFAFNVLFVADPFFTIPLLIAFSLLLFGKMQIKSRQTFSKIALVLSSLYLLYVLILKWQVNTVVVNNLNRKVEKSESYFSTPTPFNPWLWYVVIKREESFQVGYYSVFDHSDSIAFYAVLQQRKLLPLAKSTESIPHLKRFSKGYYALKYIGDTIVFNDLRFGKIMGWANPASPFVFYYYLNKSADNSVVIQRGRMQGWSTKSVMQFIERIFSAYEK